MPHECGIVGECRRQGFFRGNSDREKTVGQMRWQLARHDTSPQSIGVQSPAQRLVGDLFVDQIPEFVPENRIVLLVADENKLQHNRLRRSPRPLVRCIRPCVS